MNNHFEWNSKQNSWTTDIGVKFSKFLFTFHAIELQRDSFATYRQFVVLTSIKWKLNQLKLWTGKLIIPSPSKYINQKTSNRSVNRSINEESGTEANRPTSLFPMFYKSLCFSIYFSFKIRFLLSSWEKQKKY